MISSRFRSGALVACALLAVLVVGSTAAADDTTQPTLSIATTPQNPTPGTDVTFTATVTPGTNPDSTDLAVTCNVSWAGLSSTAPLSPDATGLVFTRVVTVPTDAVPGGRVGMCKVTDGEDRSGSAPYSLTIASPPTDAAPTVTSHTPDDGATDVAVDTNIGITFSEPVDVSGAWFSISCDGGPPLDATVSGGANSYLLSPDVDFDHGAQCTVSLVSSLITDTDTNDPPDELTGTTSWSFTTVEAAPPPNQPPTVLTTGPYEIAEGGTVSVSANGVDPEGGALTYAWDLDGDGVFETAGQTVSFSGDDGHAVQDIAVQVTDVGGLTATDKTHVTVDNVPPTATFTAPTSANAGFAFALSLTSQQDPSTADTAAGFTYRFDCGSGYGAWSSSSTASCPTSDTGPRAVRGQIRDKNLDATEYTAVVTVTVTVGSLCDLVRSYSTDPKVADDLCAKLAQAATGAAGSLGAFGNQAYAKVGKGLTAEQAAELNLLSMRL